MQLQEKSLRLGAAAIALAVVLRLFSGSAAGQLITSLTEQDVMAAMVFLETGRIVKPTLPTPAETAPTETAPTETEAATTAPAETVPPTIETSPTEPEIKAVFSETDVDLVSVNNACGYDADLPTLLQTPLDWNLREETPKVLIVHSHGTESYTKTEDYEESSAYRTRDTGHNVVSIGARLKKMLEKGGISVIHDKTMHDAPSYSNAYPNSRESIETYLKKYPSIELVLDIHRDSVESGGKQMKFAIQEDGQSVAQLMLVVGTDAAGLVHPKWPENMSLAVKLHAQLEKNTPGICRSISFRSQRFNQDLSPGALIVEVGSAGNTRAEAIRAADLLAQGIIDLAYGTS